MKASMMFTAVALAAAGALACGDTSSGTETLPASLAGVWVAEPACLPACGFTLRALANPADSVNVVAYAGVTAEITMAAAGTFRMVLRPGLDTASTAQARAAGSLLIVTDRAGAVDTLDYGVDGQYLDLVWRRVFTSVDVNRDGVADAARASGRFRRR